MNPFHKWSSAVFTVFAGMALLSCGEQKAPAAQIEAPAEQAATVESVEANDSAEQRVELGVEDFRASFERDTVIKLNEIVSRSLAVIREYDASIKQIRADVQSATAEGAAAESRAVAETGIGALAGLYDRSKIALDDMGTAVTELKASGEFYNEVILAGMIDFVEDVEREVRTEKEKLAATMTANPGG